MTGVCYDLNDTEGELRVVNPQKTPQILLRSNTQLLLTTMVQQQEVNVAMTSMAS